MESLARPPRSRWFHRHPVAALGIFVVGVVLVLDVVLGSVLGMLGLNPALRIPDRVFRTPHPVYHHDFHPGVSAEAAWGSLAYRVPRARQRARVQGPERG